MKLKIILFLVMLAVLVGCEESQVESVQQYDERHVAYLMNYGWTIDQFRSSIHYPAKMLRSLPEQVSTIRKYTKVDVTSYLDKDVIVTGYILKGTTNQYNQIVGYLIESEEKVIGGYLQYNRVFVEEGKLQVVPGEMTPMYNYSNIIGNPVIGPDNNPPRPGAYSDDNYLKRGGLQ